MAFNFDSFICLAEGGMPAAGAQRRGLHHYATADDLPTVLAAGYFSALAGALNIGDEIIVAFTTAIGSGQGPLTLPLSVVDISTAGVVTVAPFGGQGALSIPGVASTGANTTATVLATFTVTAGMLWADGRGVRLKAWGSYGATANNKTIAGLWGAATPITSGALANNGTNWQIEIEVLRTGLATQVCKGFFQYASTLIALGYAAGTEAPATAPVVLKVQGTNGTAAANDIVCRGASMEFI